MVNDNSGKEDLGKRVEILFAEGKKKNFFAGTIKKVEWSLRGKKNTIVARHFVLFDDGDKKWFDFEDLKERNELRWLKNKNDDDKDNGKRLVDEIGMVPDPDNEKKMKSSPKQEVEKTWMSTIGSSGTSTVNGIVNKHPSNVSSTII